MNDRRRFLHVFGATAASLAVPACGGDVSSTGAGGGSTTTTSATTAGTGGGAGGSSGTTGAGGNGGMPGTGGMGGQGGDPCDPNPPGVIVGSPSDYESMGLHKVPGTKVLIGRDDAGLYAMTSLCPHQFCNMNMDGTIKATGIVCTCHQSVFDNNGAVTKGPANKPLKHFALALACNGTLRANLNQTVDASTRLAV
ncbi:MAG: Rieske (2Fe-2S) protein [Byssovorax sp.]